MNHWAHGQPCDRQDDDVRQHDCDEGTSGVQKEREKGSVVFCYGAELLDCLKNCLAEPRLLHPFIHLKSDDNDVII